MSSEDKLLSRACGAIAMVILPIDGVKCCRSIDYYGSSVLVTERELFSFPSTSDLYSVYIKIVNSVLLLFLLFFFFFFFFRCLITSRKRRNSACKRRQFYHRADHFLSHKLNYGGERRVCVKSVVNGRSAAALTSSPSTHFSPFPGPAD